MTNNDPLSEFKSADINGFKKDFTHLIKIGAEIDKDYGKAQQDLDTIIPKFQKLIEEFNKKYKGIKIKIKKTIDNFKVKIFIKAKDIKEFFAESASRISGLKSVGKTNFNQVDVSDTEKFARFLDSISEQIYISYINPESGTSTITAVFDKKEKMVELLYEPNEIVNENSAGFKICAFYALKQGYDKKIDIYSDSLTFGFADLLNEVEKREWYDKFNPRFLE